MKFIKFDSNLVYYLLSAYVNMDIVYFEINRRDGFIYNVTHMKVKSIKCYLFIVVITQTLFY